VQGEGGRRRSRRRTRGGEEGEEEEQEEEEEMSVAQWLGRMFVVQHNVGGSRTRQQRSQSEPAGRRGSGSVSWSAGWLGRSELAAYRFRCSIVFPFAAITRL
jgi:hypothetical protein